MVYVVLNLVFSLVYASPSPTCFVFRSCVVVSLCLELLLAPFRTWYISSLCFSHLLRIQRWCRGVSLVGLDSLGKMMHDLTLTHFIRTTNYLFYVPTVIAFANFPFLFEVLIGF